MANESILIKADNSNTKKSFQQSTTSITNLKEVETDFDKAKQSCRSNFPLIFFYLSGFKSTSLTVYVVRGMRTWSESLCARSAHSISWFCACTKRRSCPTHCGS